MIFLNELNLRDIYVRERLNDRSIVVVLLFIVVFTFSKNACRNRGRMYTDYKHAYPEGQFFNFNLFKLFLKIPPAKYYLHPVTPLAAPDGVARAFAAPHAATRQGCHGGQPRRA
jgi:hypothetical protein